MTRGTTRVFENDYPEGYLYQGKKMYSKILNLRVKSTEHIYLDSAEGTLPPATNIKQGDTFKLQFEGRQASVKVSNIKKG